MDKKKFLSYVLYITLVEIREKAYESKDSRLFHLSDILHNIPLSLLNDELVESEYDELLKSVETLNISDWLDSRITEFRQRFPEDFV